MGVDSSQVHRLAADLHAAPAKVEARVEVAVSRSGERVQRDAQRFAPVLTGRLREGIVTEGGGLSVSVVATAPYSDYVEYGTSDTAPQPFMRPAADLAAGPLADDLGDAAERII